LSHLICIFPEVAPVCDNSMCCEHEASLPPHVCAETIDVSPFVIAAYTGYLQPSPTFAITKVNVRPKVLPLVSCVPNAFVNGGRTKLLIPPSTLESATTRFSHALRAFVFRCCPSFSLLFTMTVSYLGLSAVGWHDMLDSWWNKV